MTLKLTLEDVVVFSPIMNVIPIGNDTYTSYSRITSIDERNRFDEHSCSTENI